MTTAEEIAEMRKEAEIVCSNPEVLEVANMHKTVFANEQGQTETVEEFVEKLNYSADGLSFEP